MNIELLARQAIERIKNQWGLPKRGFLAGGALANIIWEFVSGNKAVINDIDIFNFVGIEEKLNQNKESLFNYQEKDTKYFEDYTGICFNTYTKVFYSIVESRKEDIFNQIDYKSNTNDPSLIIKSFDINATRVGYDIEKDEIYWTPEFEYFLNTGKLQVSNLMTPSHTSIRIVKKSVELNTNLDYFEIKLLQHALSFRFSDSIKFRFKQRYFDLYKDYENLLSGNFSIHRDNDAEDYVRTNFNIETEMYYLKSTVSYKSNSFEEAVNRSCIFIDDANVNNIFKSSDFLFYMRNVYGNEELKNLWKSLGWFYKDNDYVDCEISKEDIQLLSRVAKYAPNSIENLKGLKLSEQINLIKKLFDKYQDDPIVAISILESFKLDKDLQLDEQTSLILELSVRKLIVNDTRGKVRNILEKSDENKDSNTDIFIF